MELISSVSSIDIAREAGLPQTIRIAASGIVNAHGWTYDSWFDPVVSALPSLVPEISELPPPDGYLDLAFIAQRPEHGEALHATTVTAEVHINRDEANFWGRGIPLRGVRVRSYGNTLEATWHRPSDDLLIDNRWVPWPWSSKAGNAHIPHDWEDAMGDRPPVAWPWHHQVNLLQADKLAHLADIVCCLPPIGPDSQVIDLLGHRLRIYRIGKDALINDYVQGRINIGLNEKNVIESITFG